MGDAQHDGWLRIPAQQASSRTGGRALVTDSERSAWPPRDHVVEARVVEVEPAPSRDSRRSDLVVVEAVEVLEPQEQPVVHEARVVDTRPVGHRLLDTFSRHVVREGANALQGLLEGTDD